MCFRPFCVPRKKTPRTICSVFAPFADENRLLRLAFAPTQCESLYLNKTKNATPMEAVPKTVFRMRI